MNFFALSALINFATSSILGFFVISKNRNGKNVGFFLFCLSVALWSLFYYFWQISDSAISALFWTRMLMAAAIFIPISYLYFVFAVIEQIQKRKKFLIASLFLFLFFLSISFTPYFVSHVESLMIFKFWPIAGNIYSLFLAIWSIYVVYSTYLLLKKYRQSNGIAKLQIKYIIIGMVIGFGGGVTNYFLWYRIPILPVGNILVSVYVATVAYAIIRYRFMDIRIVARRIFIYLGIAAFAYAIFYFLVWAYDTFFGGVFTTVSYVAGLVVAPLFVLSFYGLEKGLSRFSNKYLFASLYNYQTAINKLIDEVNYHIDLDKVVHLIAKTIQEAMKIKGVSVTLIDLADNNAIIKTINIDKANALPSANGAVVDFLNRRPKPIVIEELEIAYEKEELPKAKKDLQALIAEMKNCQKCSLILPLVSNKRVVGVILLGKRQGGDPYTHEDLDFLEILSKQAGIAVENAIMYQKTQSFNQLLQQKVSEQTKDINEKNKDITKKNQYLQELLQMKSDFLRVVNHQLNTPLSIMKSAYSMVKEKTFSPQKGFSYSSTALQRLDDTIHDFWDAYELEGDKMKMAPEQVDLEKIVNALVKEKQKMELAIKRQIKVSAIKPKFKMPLIWCDSKKIIHVISNLLDNAIYYTREGSVTVAYELLGKTALKVNIADTGTGISSADKRRLFQKFSRGVASTNLHPDGSGLGLYIAKKIVEGNNGELTYNSDGPGKGSTFSFTLPIYSNQKAKPGNESNNISRDSDVVMFKRSAQKRLNKAKLKT